MTNPDAVLKLHLARLDGADERRRLSSDPSDYTEVLALLEEMIEACVDTALQRLGERRDPGGSTVDAIHRVADLVARRPAALSDDTPVGLLSDQVRDLVQALRDIDYLRRGFGVRGGRPRPDDMRAKHAAPLESSVIDVLHQLLGSFAPAAGEERVEVRDVDVDLATLYAGVLERLARPLGARDFMRSVVELCRFHAPVDGWDEFLTLPYEQELRRRSSFLLDVVAREAAPVPLVAFYVEIIYPGRGGDVVADVVVAGADRYEPHDERWLESVTYRPRDGMARSEVLASIYRTAYAPGGLGNAADYPLTLAWATYFARACCRRYVAETGRGPVGLSVGFTDGDWIDVGWVEPT